MEGLEKQETKLQLKQSHSEFLNKVQASLNAQKENRTISSTPVHLASQISLKSENSDLSEYGNALER